MISGIYKIVNTVNGKIYYGSSVDIHKRWKQHTTTLSQNCHQNIHLQRAWHRYGSSVFEFHVVEVVSKESLLIKEQEYLDTNSGGYNIAPASGGDTLSKHPNRIEIIARRSNSQRIRNSKLSPEERVAKWGKFGKSNGMYGKHHTTSSKIAIREKTIGISRNKGIPKSFEHRAKMSIIAKERIGKKNPFFGKHHSEITKQKLSDIQKENSWIKGIDPAHLSYTKIYELVFPDGEIEQVCGLKEIATRYNVSITAIHSIIKRARPNKSGVLKAIMIRVATPIFPS